MSSIFRNLRAHTNPRHFSKTSLSDIKKIFSVNFQKGFSSVYSGLLFNITLFPPCAFLTGEKAEEDSTLSVIL